MTPRTSLTIDHLLVILLGAAVLAGELPSSLEIPLVLLAFLAFALLFLLADEAATTWRGGPSEVFDERREGTAPPSGKLHAPPGGRLRAFASFFFSRRTYNEVLEPTLRDLIDEYLEALQEQRLWKARWVQIRGYFSFWSAVVARMPVSMAKVVYRIWRTTR